MNKALIVILVLSVSATVSHAQTKKWSLKECIDYAIAHNLDVRQSEMNLKSATMDYKQSQYSLLPNLSASAGQNYQFGRTIDRFTNQFVNQTIRSNNMSLNGSVTLFNGFQNQNTIKQQSYTMQAVEQTLQVTKNTISLNVASLFLQILFNQESIQNTKNQNAATVKQIERAEKLMQSGATDQSNWLSLKAQSANEQLTLVTSTNLLNSNMLALKNLMQLPPDETFEIEIPNIDATIISYKPSVAEVYDASVTRMPEVKSAQLRVNSATMQQRVSQGLRSPNISVFANLNTVYSQNAKEIYNPRLNGTTLIGYTENTNEKVYQPIIAYDTKVIDFGKQLKNNFGQSAGISLSWTLFNANQVNNSIRKAKLTYEQSRLNEQKARNTLYTDITKAVSDLNAAEAKMIAGKNSLDAQKLSLDYAEKRFEAGVTNAVDLVTVKNAYTNAISVYLQARYEYVFRALILDYYKGNPIQL